MQFWNAWRWSLLENQGSEESLFLEVPSPDPINLCFCLKCMNVSAKYMKAPTIVVIKYESHELKGNTRVMDFEILFWCHFLMKTRWSLKLEEIWQRSLEKWLARTWALCNHQTEMKRNPRDILEGEEWEEQLKIIRFKVSKAYQRERWPKNSKKWSGDCSWLREIVSEELSARVQYLKTRSSVDW